MAEIYESDLEDYIADNINRILGDTFTLFDRQMWLEGCRADIVAIEVIPDGFLRDFVWHVIEVKRDIIDSAAVFQVLNYMAQLKDVSDSFQRRTKMFSDVHGWVAAPDIDAEACCLLRLLKGVDYMGIKLSLVGGPSGVTTSDRDTFIELKEEAHLEALSLVSGMMAKHRTLTAPDRERVNGDGTDGMGSSLESPAEPRSQAPPPL